MHALTSSLAPQLLYCQILVFSPQKDQNSFHGYILNAISCRVHIVTVVHVDCLCYIIVGAVLSYMHAWSLNRNALTHNGKLDHLFYIHPACRYNMQVMQITKSKTVRLCRINSKKFPIYLNLYAC